VTLYVPVTVLSAATDPFLAQQFETATGWRRADEVRIQTDDLTEGRLADLAKASVKANDRSFGRIVESIQRAKSGKFDKSVPNLRAFPEVFKLFLRHHFIDGWLYRVDGDRVSAWLVENVEYDDGTSSRSSNDRPSVTVTLTRTGVLDTRHGGNVKRGRGLTSTNMRVEGSDVTKKKVADILTNEDYLVETPELRKAYDEQTAHHRDVLLNGFAQQFRYTGTPSNVDRSYSERWVPPSPIENHKVVDDTEPSDVDVVATGTSKVFTEDGDEKVLPVPMAHQVQVFDLATHDFMTVYTQHLTAYVYDSSLADKLVLPESHRDLLDILTSNIGTFTGDIIEGKSAGNVILAKGVPGVGKTLTAEVYSELIQRPLYSIHSGSLGVTADSVRKNLEEVFKRAKRWNAVLLLDEADVFVNERGTDITQNAIVAEFLRTMEYFDGLMFMTTNRASNIDEAIISRCAAIINYEIPNHDDAVRIWHVLANNFGAEMDDQLVERLANAFHDIAPRDIKMLLRLALRVAKHDGVQLDAEIFRKVAMFRGLTYHTTKEA
jgi:DNA polymerase III delta prime subunit